MVGYYTITEIQHMVKAVEKNLTAQCLHCILCSSYKAKPKEKRDAAKALRTAWHSRDITHTVP